MNKTDDHERIESRQRKLLDREWRFRCTDAAETDPNYGFMKAGKSLTDLVKSTQWQTVDLPHDWAVALPFSAEGRVGSGSKDINTGADRRNAVGWYMKEFTVAAEEKGRRFTLEFEGVFRDSIVWVNGHYMGRHTSGYTGFSYDITDVLNDDRVNQLVVRVEATQNEGWWYDGAGIYRHVWLTSTNPLHIANEGGVHIIADPAQGVHMTTSVTNEANERQIFVVCHTVCDPSGQPVATYRGQSVSIAAWHTECDIASIDVTHPQLWSVDMPHLYTVKTEIQIQHDHTGPDGWHTIDRIDSTFGFRTFTWDAERGFFLNGQPLKIKGVCCHQDHAGVGTALPDGLQWHRIAKLKEMGCNALRTSHNPPTPALLEACDRLGMLVMDEQRLLGSSKEALDQLERLIVRDRNHACVFLWSIGNEEFTQNTSIGKAIAVTMMRKVKALDPTRLVSYGGNNGKSYEGINQVVDVRGWNYVGIRQHFEDTDEYHKLHPHQPIIGSEEASCLTTRGVYETDLAQCHLSAYDEHVPPWGATPEEWWNYYDSRDYIAGGFAWTGFDYRGEPTPFEWPAIASQFGILDLCGFPKDSFYFYQAWWTKEPVLHLLPHWNWAGKEGCAIPVRCYSNCDEVELFLNGITLGRQTMVKNSFLSWKVPYSAGCLEAVGYTQGREVCRTSVSTTREAHAIQLKHIHTHPEPDGRQAHVIHVSVQDDQGHHIATANNKIQFSMSGHGRILGVGNGDPSSHEADQCLETFERRPVTGWQSCSMEVTLEDASELPSIIAGLDDARWEVVPYLTRAGRSTGEEDFRRPSTVPIHAPSGGTKQSWVKLTNPSQIVTFYRTTFDISADEQALGWQHLILKAGSGNLFAYNHDELIAQGATDWFEQQVALAEGRHVITLAIFGTGGMQAFLEKAELARVCSPVWGRSLFNGWASVIIQTESDAANVMFSAKSDGLLSRTIVVATDTV
jgi:beta-galactosidase